MKTSWPTILTIALFSLLGAITISFSTRWGPWAYSDSTTYMVSARSLLAGEGLSVYIHPGSVEHLTHHPPLYPLVLSAISLSGIKVLTAARWLNILLFTALIFSTGGLTYRLLRSSWMAISLSASWFALPALMDIYSGAMSEPLFLFTGITGTLLIVLYLKTQQRRTLLLAATAAGAAFLTRYIGVFAPVAGIITLLCLSRSTWKRRLQDLVLYGLVSGVPNAAWWLYVYLSTSTYAARQVINRPDLKNVLIELRLLLMEVFWNWLPFTQGSTYSYNLALKVLLMLSMLSLLPVGLVIWKWWRDRQAATRDRQVLNYFLTWGIFSLAYLGFLAYSFVFTEPQPDIDLRMLLPVQISLLIVLLSGSLLFLKSLRLHPWSILAPITLLVGYLAAFLPASLDLVREYYRQGGGYTSLEWHQSETLAALNQLPADLPIITNEAAAVVLWTGRASYDFCTLPCKQAEDVRYGDNPDDAVQRIFRDEGAALVLFHHFCASRTEPWNLEWLTQVEALTRDLSEYEYSCDGAIYFYP